MDGIDENEVEVIASGTGAMRTGVVRKAVDDVDAFRMKLEEVVQLFIAGIALAVADGPARHMRLPLVISDIVLQYCRLLKSSMCYGKEQYPGGGFT